MLNRNRKTIALMVITMLVFISLLPARKASAATTATINQAWSQAIAYYELHPDKLNSFLSPWLSAVALGSKASPLVSSVSISLPDISTADKEAQAKPVTIAGTIIGLVAQGQNPTQVQINGQTKDLVNLLAKKQLGDGCFGAVTDTLNNTIWAVIAMDMYNCNYAANQVYYDGNAAVNYIKGKQKASGGFDEGGWGEDADSTSHALIALAGHLPASDQVIQKAFAYLKNDELQSSTGAIMSWGADSTDSTAAVIEALVAWGISPQEADWVKDGKSLIDGLLVHQINGGFVETASWGELNSSGSGLCALADLSNGYSKYRTHMPLTWIKAEGPTSLSSNHDCDLTIRVTNPGNIARDQLIIAALYNPQGKMVTYSYGLYRLAPGEERTAGLGFGINAAAGSLVKVMVWDNWNDRNPLTTPITYSVQ